MRKRLCYILLLLFVGGPQVILATVCGKEDIQKEVSLQTTSEDSILLGKIDAVKASVDILMNHTEKVKENTDIWDDLWSGSSFVLALFASLVTVIGVAGLFVNFCKKELRKRGMIKDLLRHFYKSYLKICALEKKLGADYNEKYPSRLKFDWMQSLGEDVILNNYQSSPSSYLQAHRICCNIRNYNMTATYVGSLLGKQEALSDEKKELIEELKIRNVEIRKSLIRLSYSSVWYIEFFLYFVHKRRSFYEKKIEGIDKGTLQKMKMVPLRITSQLYEYIIKGFENEQESYRNQFVTEFANDVRTLDSKISKEDKMFVYSFPKKLSVD